MSGWEGPDHLFTGRGSDVVRTFGSRDEVWLDSIPDHALLGPRDRNRDEAPDRAVMGPGGDTVNSGGGNDDVSGGVGPDDLTDWGRAVDVIRGGSGDDAIQHRMVFKASGVVLAGGPGADRVRWSDRVRPELGDVTTVDLRSGVLEHDPEVGPTVTHVMSSFRDGELGDWGTLRVFGTDEANFLSFFAPQMSVSALAGDDLLRTAPITGSTFDGGDGFDRLSQADCAQNTCISIEAFFPL